MKFSRKWFIFILLLTLLFTMGSVFSADLEDMNTTSVFSVSSDDGNTDYQLQGVDDKVSLNVDDSELITESNDEIEVQSWDDIQDYASRTDKNYVLRLKENTNYYPDDPTSTDYQIIFNNNVTIIGAEGAYIGDTSPNPRNITYTAMLVPDNSGVGITMQGVTFKWIGTRYQPDGVFLQMGGNVVNYFEDCYFTEIGTNLGHSSIVYIKLGDAIIDNCTFINCTTDFGCLSVYNPNDDPTKTCVLARMNVTNSYFEGNYAMTEPGCINNCGILVVRNSTFYHNSAFWWAGAIHTHGGANTTLYDCNFTDNVAGWNGGALYTYSYLQIYRCIFLGNNCTTNNGGGAIGACKYLHAPYIYIEDSLFENNENTCWSLDELSTSGTGRGGAISLMDQGSLEVRNTTFIKNSASIGTAICAINGGLQMGSPDVIIVGNRFINHTRVGDVLDVRLADGSIYEVHDNYYFNNSFEFKKLRLLDGGKVAGQQLITIDAELKNPNSFESDILDTCEYEVYVDGVYNKTVVGRSFTLPLEDGQTCNVYVAPCISDSISNQILVGVPKEYIYVSPSGRDTNDGLNRSTPVKTIAKAIELARTKGNIIIMGGTYSESNLTVDYNLTITGENNVKFSGNVPINVQTIFTVTNYADLSLKGITFDNIVFAANTTYKNKRVILQDTGYLTIEDCTFSQISPIGNTGMNLIESPNVEVYNSVFTNNNKASVYITMIKSNEYLVDNCTFTNNIASHSTYDALIKTVNTKTGIKGTVTNSIFENNKVKHGCVYFGSSGKPITISNTKFIANTVGGTSDHASCIKVEESPTLTVDSVVFKDNINLGTRAAVIYCSGSTGSIYVSNSIIINNSYSNNNHAIFSASTANNMKAYKNLNGNWWGNTIENYDVAPAVYATACNNWVILNITANVTSLGTNQNALVSFDLNNAYDKEFNESFFDARYLPSFDLDIQTTGGSSNVNKVTVEQGRASAIYTLQSDSGSLTASYGDVVSTINFEWSLIDPEISIDVENVTYGENAIINLNLPSDISINDISLTLNQNALTVQNPITVSGLNAGDYVLNLTYNGNSKYNPFNLVQTFSVNKADPELSIAVNDEYYYGNNVGITVNTNSAATGTISIQVGDVSQSKAISNGKASFTVSGLAANNYTVIATYAETSNFLPGEASSNFVVKKYNSTITISNSAISLGSDVVLTFNVNSDATGTVTVNINGVNHNVNVANGKATYTINSISRGLYNIEATYNGDAKYLPSSNTTVLDVARLNPNLAATINNINYGQDATVQITLSNSATGSVTVTVDGISQTVSVSNGKATATISGITAGTKSALISYSGDNTYLPANLTKSFSVAKSQPTININALDIKEGQVATIQITISQGATGTLTLNYAGKTENVNVPRTGVITRTASDLSVGNYPISVSYSGDSNYLAATASGSFSVNAWENAQWPNEGYDIANSGKSPYSTETNGNVKWTVNVNGEIIGNMIIDSVGNIYITTANGIYSYNNNGNLNWNFNSEDAGEDFSGIAVGREVIVAPKSGDKLYFINQTTGQKYNNNIYHGSSIFVPVMGDNGNIYITSEYQYSSECYNLVIVPYRLWQTSTPPTLISLGQDDPTTAPVVIDDDFVAIGTVGGLKIVDLSSGSVVSTYDDVITSVRPIIGDDGLIYAVTEDNLIMCIDPIDGVQWTSVVTGNHSDSFTVVDDAVYSVNKQGKLYQYFYGEETLIFDFNETISSGILLGNDGTLYLGSENGIFYAINPSGEIQWKVSLGDSILGSPIMDSNGVIYTIIGNKIYALSKTALINPGLAGTINDVDYGNDVIVNIELNSEATGIVSITVGNEYYETEVNNGKASFTLSDLEAGTYTATIQYNGDSRFKQESKNIGFQVNKADVNMTVIADNIKVGDNLIVVVSNMPVYATGTVTVSVSGKSNTANVINGGATLSISGLTKGDHDYTVTYSGDNNYNQASVSKTVSVGLVQTSFSASTSDIYVGQTAIISVTGLPNDANGVTYVILNGQTYSATVQNGASQISIPNLSQGSYELNVMYTNDTKYMANSKDVVLNVNKVSPSMTITANNVNVGSALPITVNLNNDASGSVLISVGDVSNNVTVVNGVASTSISGLTAGTYNIDVSYSGDNKYNPTTGSKTVSVSKNTATMTITANNINVGSALPITVNLNNDASGSVLISVGDVSNNVTVVNGVASTSISGLTADNYIISASYSGDEKYNARTVTKQVTVSKIDVTFNVESESEIYEGQDVTIAVSNLPADASGNVLVMGDISGTGEVINGAANIVISNLTAGEYTFSTYYSGNYKYNSNTVSNSKVTVKAKEKVILRSSNIVMEYQDGTKYNVKLTDYDGNNIVGAVVKFVLDGNEYSLVTGDDGVASLPLNLGIGVYSVNATFEGNVSHESASVSNTITVDLISVILSADDVEMFVGDGINYQILLTDSSGNPLSGFTLDVNNTLGVYYYRTNSLGIANANLAKLKPGSYVISTTFNGTDIYKSATLTGNVLVKAKEKVTISSSDIVMEYHDGTNYDVKLTDADGNNIVGAVVKFVLDGNEYSLVTGDDGVASLPLNLGIGVYNVNATFEGNVSHESASASNTITVNKITVTLTTNDINMTYGDGTNYEILVTDINGNPISGLTLDVNNTIGIYYYKTNSKGIATANLAKLKPGTYAISAKFNGTDIYNSDSVTNTVTINKIGVNLAASDVSMEYGDGTKYEVLVTDMFGNPISGVTIDVNNTLGVYYYKTNSKGIASANLARLKDGSYIISAKYNGTDIYESAYITNNVIVHDPNKKIPADINITTENICYGEDLVVNLTLPSDVKYRVNVTVGGVSKLVSLKNGIGSVKFSGLTIGTYNVSAYYAGDSYYLKSYASVNVKVEKAVPTIKVIANAITFGEDLVVNVELPSDVSRRASVTIDNETKFVSLKEGKGSVKFSNLAMGNYRVTASYSGDANYHASSVTINAKVNRPKATINVIADDINCGEDLVVSVELPSDVSRRAKVTIGDESKFVSLKEGKGSVKFSGLAIGTYDVVVDYEGDSNYYKTSVSTTVKVNKGLATINMTANDVAYGEDLVVDLQLPSDVSRRVSVTIGNETKLVSLKDGKGSVKFSGLEMGTYTITASYDGDSNYLKSTASITAKVTKAKPEIQVTANDITCGESLNVNVKLPSDVTRRAVVTIDGESKYVSLKNGEGSVKFDGLSVGTHDVVVSYSGDSLYAASSTTTKIHVN